MLQKLCVRSRQQRADGGYADLAVISRGKAAAAAHKRGLWPLFLNGGGEHTRRAARSVRLAAVMRLHDLDLRLRKQARGLAHKAAERRNAETHVAGKKDGDLR